MATSRHFAIPPSHESNAITGNSKSELGRNRRCSLCEKAYCLMASWNKIAWIIEIKR